MARKISISFKETTKDMELYNFIMSLEDKSSEIKFLLRKALKDEKINKDEKIEKVEKEVDILNF